jgi:hypothetical protein
MMEHRYVRRLILGAALFGVTALYTGCRSTFDEPVRDTTGEDGEAGMGYTAQCSGWFPDWISRTAPPEDEPSFQLAQGYPLGIPRFEDGELVGWDPLEPYDNAPWLAHDFMDPNERLDYLTALKDYALSDLVPYDFVPQNKRLGKKHWYHVPMMTSGFFAREARHGLTEERTLRANEQSWLSSSVGAYGIGLYNRIGGYTVGQVFNDPEPSNAQAANAEFIDGALVVKVLFAEYDPGAIVGPDPLANAPAWQIQDPFASSSDTFEVRLIQMDIAVKDPRSPDTGWVFATYVYDESLPAASPQDRWYNLTPVGLAWGNDPDVTANNDPDLDETWINPAVPSPFNADFGLHGRLNGPVDNPESACMSCHSTAQVRTDRSNSVGAYTAARMLPDDTCTDAQAMHWFRNIPGDEPFGQMNVAPGYCQPSNPPVATPPMHSLDYSLQIQRGLVNGVALNHENPCLSLIPADQLPDRAEQQMRMAVIRGEMAPRDVEKQSVRTKKAQALRARDDLPSWKAVGMDPSDKDAEYYPGR